MHSDRCNGMWLDLSSRTRLDENVKFIEDLQSRVNGSRIPARWTVNVAAPEAIVTLRKIEAIDASLFSPDAVGDSD